MRRVPLKQILINHLSNAIKFTDHGSVRMVVGTAQSADDRAELRFTIVDTGIGMTEAPLAQLFKPFAQADASTTRRYGGGLGLTISRHLAEAMGGRLEVASKDGEGSSFVLNLDIGPARELEFLEVTRKEPPLAAPSAWKDGARRLSGRVLLAGDGLDNQRLITHVLRQAGLTVELAENGRIAVDLAWDAWKKGDPYAVILMDMQMPEMEHAKPLPQPPAADDRCQVGDQGCALHRVRVRGPAG